MGEGVETAFPKLSFIPMTPLVVYLIFHGLIALSNIAINSLLVYALYRLQKLQIVSFRFIAVLSISDIGTGVIQPILAITSLATQQQHRSDTFALAEQFLSLLFAFISINMIVIITMDRFIHMKYSKMYNTVMSPKRSVHIILLNLSASIGIVTTFTFASIYDFYKTLVTIWLIAAYLLLLTVTALYSYTFYNLRNQVKNMNSEIRQSIANQRADRRFAKGMVVILCTLIACYVPVSITATVFGYQRASIDGASTRVMTALHFCYLLKYLNSSLNAIVFISFNKQIKAYIREMVYCRRNVGQEMGSSTTPTELTKQ